MPQFHIQPLPIRNDWCPEDQRELLARYWFYPCQLGVAVRIAELENDQLQMDLTPVPFVISLDKLAVKHPRIDWPQDDRIRPLVPFILTRYDISLDDAQTLIVHVQRKKLLSRTPLHA